MSDISLYNDKIFEQIKHMNENGIEYWEARELQRVLEYAQWRRFEAVINRAMIACKLSTNNVSDYFAKVGKTIQMPKNATKEVEDYRLSRYACYLIVQNGDSKKQVIALGQTYFAVQTRKQEITEEEYLNLTEDEKRLYTRINVNNKNYFIRLKMQELKTLVNLTIMDIKDYIMEKRLKTLLQERILMKMMIF